MRRLRRQEGSVLVTAVLLMTAMVGVSLAAYSVVDTQERLSAGERKRETSFNFTEQLLNTQVFILSRDWPAMGSQANPYPNCANGATSDRCPNATALLSRFGGTDLAAGATWSTKVRDNQLPNLNYYDDATTQQQPGWDANLDGKVWVRAQANVRGKRRTLVALVKVDQQLEDLPKSVLIAGKFETTNNGKKVIVNTQGSAASPAPLQVRCLVRNSACLGYQASKGQVSPDTTQVGFAGGNALSDDAIDRLRERASAEGTYFAGCPANPSGALVFVEQGDCSYNNSAGACCNTKTSPGVLVIRSGTLSMNGNIVFHGMVYMPNRQSSSGWVVSLGGTAAIEGAVSIDGAGGLSAGSSGVNVVYDPNVFNKVTSYPNAGIVQNTWREIPAAAG